MDPSVCRYGGALVSQPRPEGSVWIFWIASETENHRVHLDPSIWFQRLEIWMQAARSAACIGQRSCGQRDWAVSATATEVLGDELPDSGGVVRLKVFAGEQRRWTADHGLFGQR